MRNPSGITNPNSYRNECRTPIVKHLKFETDNSQLVAVSSQLIGIYDFTTSGSGFTLPWSDVAASLRATC
jgi:hypothetical protein